MSAFSQIVKNYLSEGFSVIPLVGGDDVTLGKRAVLPWSVYQRQQPTINELQALFEVARGSAFGVVCRRVSRLVVLDIDDGAVVAAFRQRFPQPPFWRIRGNQCIVSTSVALVPLFLSDPL